MCFFFGREVCGILAPQPGMEPVLSALEGNVLTSGLPGKSLSGLFQVLRLSPEPLLPLFNPTRSLLLVVKMQTTYQIPNFTVNLYELEKHSNCLYLKKKSLYLDLCLTQEQLLEAATTNVVENGSRGDH